MSGLGIRFLTWLALILLAAGPGSSAAQPPAPAPSAPEPANGEPLEYRNLINAALDEYEAHNFVEARALFMQAHDAYPNARTLRGLGMAEFELKNYPDSVRSLEASLASPVRRLEGDLLQQTQDLLARARRFVARYTLHLTPAVSDGLRLVLDREPITPGPNLTLMLPIGEHVLLVKAPGYFEEKRTLSIKAAEERTLPIELRRELDNGANNALAQQPRSDKQPLYKNPWLWSGVGAVILGGIVAGVVLSLDKGGDSSGPRPHATVATLLQAGR